MSIIINKWTIRLVWANNDDRNKRLVRLLSLCEDIDALANSLFRAGYLVHPTVAEWLVCVEESVYKHMSDFNSNKE